MGDCKQCFSYISSSTVLHNVLCRYLCRG